MSEAEVDDADWLGEAEVDEVAPQSFSASICRQAVIHHWLVPLGTAWVVYSVFEPSSLSGILTPMPFMMRLLAL